MRTCRILAFVVALSLAGVGWAQVGEPVTFDFEGMTLQDLIDAGWQFVDDIGVTTDPNTTPPTVEVFPDTIQIETTIVHSGTQALRLGLQDLAYFPLVHGDYGILDLWAYDHGYLIDDYIDAAYGHRHGLGKYDVNDPVAVAAGITEGFAYGIGGGLVRKSYLASNGGYGVEWGLTSDALRDTLVNDPGATPWSYHGWPGTQSWFSCYWGGTIPRPDSLAGESGWNHWRIAYLGPGEVELEILETWNGHTNILPGPPAEAPGNAFNGAIEGGPDTICLFGGSTFMAGLAPALWFGDGIFDDITWTPVEPPIPPKPGDADDDGDVDLDDFVILKNEFGAVPPPALRADFDDDGDVDLDDFVILKNNFGT